MKFSIFYSMLMIMILVSNAFTSEISIKTVQDSSEQKKANVVKNLKTIEEEKTDISQNLSGGNSQAIPNLLGNTGSSSSSKKKSQNPYEEIEPCDKEQQSKIKKYKDEFGKGMNGRVIGNSKSNEVAKEIEVTPSKENEIKMEIENSLLFQDSDHVINSYEACYTDKDKRLYYIFMEKCSVDLDTWFTNNVREGDVNGVKEVIKQVAQAYIELHSQFILHNDIHLRNLMMCGDKIKIIDLGQSTKISSFDSNGPDGGKVNYEYKLLFMLFRQLLLIKKIDGTELNKIIDEDSKNIERKQIPDLNDLIDQLARRVLLLL
jgi:hypothetical protein